jgi:hypothetical protein
MARDIDEDSGRPFIKVNHPAPGDVGWEHLERELIRVRNEQTPRPSRPAGRV